jgi:glycerol-3-phosphate dehydrogenase
MDRRHGEGGVFVAGEWVPIENCADSAFLCREKSTSTKQYRNSIVDANCTGCRRNRTRISRANSDGSYDVVIIGAGVVGGCIARELSRTQSSVLVLEAADDVCAGASKANSGVTHAGYDAEPDTLKAKLNAPGCRMFPKLDEELHFGFNKCGSFVVAFGKKDEELLETLLQRGVVNGVKNLSIIRNPQKLREMEPALSKEATAALWAKDAGIIIPYEFCIALFENAVDNGVEVRLRHDVVGIRPNYSEGSSPQSAAGGKAPDWWEVEVQEWLPVPTERPDQGAVHRVMPSPGTILKGEEAGVRQVIRTRTVINCTGLHADEIAAMVNEHSFHMLPRRGDYLLLHKRQGSLAQRVLFPCPDPVLGKGILVLPTLWGNLLLGPTAIDIPAPPIQPSHSSAVGSAPTPRSVRDRIQNANSKHHSNTPEEEILSKLLTQCHRLVPSIDTNRVIHGFAGVRSRTTEGDWIIRSSTAGLSFIHVAGIDSPGLTSSPMIALEVLKLLRTCAPSEVRWKLDAPNASFNPIREPIIRPKNLGRDMFGQPLDFSGAHKDGKSTPHSVPPTPANRRVVCFCEKVTESEIVDAIHRSLPVDGTQGVRRRCRAGMGQCQGQRCEEEVARIISRETGLGLAEVVRRPWPASSLLPQRWLVPEDYAFLRSLSPVPTPKQTSHL